MATNNRYMRGEAILRKAQEVWNKRNKPKGAYAERTNARQGLENLGKAFKNFKPMNDRGIHGGK